MGGGVERTRTHCSWWSGWRRRGDEDVGGGGGGRGCR